MKERRESTYGRKGDGRASESESEKREKDKGGGESNGRGTESGREGAARAGRRATCNLLEGIASLQLRIAGPPPAAGMSALTESASALAARIRRGAPYVRG